jgi:hypothetical protein
MAAAGDSIKQHAGPASNPIRLAHPSSTASARDSRCAGALPAAAALDSAGTVAVDSAESAVDTQELLDVDDAAAATLNSRGRRTRTP